jgi:hypothetical protein
MRRSCQGLLFVVFVAALCMTGNGCSYLANRVCDYVDRNDFGISLSDLSSPDLLFFVAISPVFALGAGEVDGRYFGVGTRELGLKYIHHICIGAGLYGSEKYGIGASKADADARGQWYSLGFLPVYDGDSELPPWTQWGDATFSLHVLWFGGHFRLRTLETVDLVLGIFGLDLFEDDQYPIPAYQEIPKEERPAPPPPTPPRKAPPSRPPPKRPPSRIP